MPTDTYLVCGVPTPVPGGAFRLDRADDLPAQIVPCPDCGAGAGEECVWACSSNWV